MFSKHVSVYEVGRRGVAAADVYPGDVEPSPSSRLRVSRHEAGPEHGGGEYLAPLHIARPSIASALAVLGAKRAVSSPSCGAQRCTSVAVHYALLCVTAAVAADGRLGSWDGIGDRCRVIVCTTGPCSTGPGSCVHGTPPSVGGVDAPGSTLDCAYNNRLGVAAAAMGAGLDIFCVSDDHEDFGVRCLQRVTAPGGGTVVVEKDFGPRFRADAARGVVTRDGAAHFTSTAMPSACAGAGTGTGVGADAGVGVDVGAEADGHGPSLGSSRAAAAVARAAAKRREAAAAAATAATGGRPATCPHVSAMFGDPYAGMHVTLLVSSPLFVSRVIGPVHRAVDVVRPPAAGDGGDGGAGGAGSSSGVEASAGHGTALPCRWAEPCGGGAVVAYDLVLRRCDASLGVVFVFEYSADPPSRRLDVDGSGRRSSRGGGVGDADREGGSDSDDGVTAGAGATRASAFPVEAADNGPWTPPDLVVQLTCTTVNSVGAGRTGGAEQRCLVYTAAVPVSEDPCVVLEELDQALTAVMMAKSVVQDVDKKICFGQREKRARELIGEGMAWGRATVTLLCHDIVRVSGSGWW